MKKILTIISLSSLAILLSSGIESGNENLLGRDRRLKEIGVPVVPMGLRVAPARALKFGQYNFGSQQLAPVLPPFTGRKFVGFRESLAFKESTGNYFIKNTLGYMGKYQFGAGTLALVGIRDTTNFLLDTRLQEMAFIRNLSRNKWVLRRWIAKFSGLSMNGIALTESGLLAAAHLAGPGNVKKFLRSRGESDMIDAYGTQISDYIRDFAGYDLSLIAALPKPSLLK